MGAVRLSQNDMDISLVIWVALGIVNGIFNGGLKIGWW